MPGNPPVHNLPSVAGTGGDVSYKRQKISESTDFTMTNELPRTKSSSFVQSLTACEEDKSEVELIKELKAGASPSKTKFYKDFAGLKTISEGITVEYAEALKGKEKAIRDLENIEESKILDSQVDETSLLIQKSVFKDNRPMFYSNLSSSVIKCFCGDSMACDIGKLMQ